MTKEEKSEIQRCYELITYWSKEAHKWRDAFVTLSRYKSDKHLFDNKLREAELFLIDYPSGMILSKDKLSHEEIIKSQ